MYSLLLHKYKEKKTAKGVKRSFVSKYIRHNQYVKCLVDEEMPSAKFNNIPCRKQELHTAVELELVYKFGPSIVYKVVNSLPVTLNHELV